MSQEFIPYQYQAQLIQEMQAAHCFGCFAFPGSGKTVMSLDTVYQKKKPTLVITPLSILYTTWLTEHRKWDFSQNLRLNILHGKDKDVNFHKQAGVHLINPEGVPWLVKKMFETRKFPYANLIVDESPRFKNPQSKRFKELKKVLPKFEHRYALAGNPIPNHYLDLWSQVYILDLGARLGHSFWKFRDRFFYPTDYKRFNWELKPNAKDEIIELISDITSFLDISDVTELNIPKRIVTDIPLFLPPTPRKEYIRMERKLFAILDDKPKEILEQEIKDSSTNKVLASTRAVAHLKCWQIANGFIYESLYEDELDPEKVTGRHTHLLHTELIDRASSLVNELQGNPIIIAYMFEQDRQALQKAFPNAPVAGAGITPGELQRLEKNWNDSKIEILLAHVGKLSHGLNLQYGVGHNILFYSLTYNYDEFDQLIRRLERQNADYSHVAVFRLVMQDTIHEAIIENLDRKGSQASDFLTSLMEYKERKQKRLKEVI